jgi:hypothetical protein
MYDGPYLPDTSIGESHGMKWFGTYHFTPITDSTTTQTRTNKLFLLFFRIFIVLDLAMTLPAQQL